MMLARAFNSARVSLRNCQTLGLVGTCITYHSATFWAMDAAEREGKGGFETERDIVEEREKAHWQGGH